MMCRVSLRIVFAYLLVMLGANVAALAQPSLTISDANVGVGDMVDINVSFAKNGSQVSGITFDVVFDDSVVGFDDVMEGADLGDFGLVFQDRGGGRITIGTDPPNVFPIPSVPDGVIAVIQFTALAGGDTNLVIEQSEGTASIFVDTDGAPVASGPLNNGLITVQAGPTPSPSPPPGMANVTIEKTANTNRVQPGEETEIIYTITIQSDGDVAAENVMVTDNLPVGAELTSAPGCSETDPGIVECDVGMLPVDDGEDFTITIRITPEGASILNQAIVDFLGGENSDTVTIRVGGSGTSSSGCALASGPTYRLSAIGSLLALFIPAVAIGIRRLRKKSS